MTRGLRSDKPTFINGININYVNGGVSISRGGGKRETRGQVQGQPTHIQNIDENFSTFKIEVENTDSNLATFDQFFANGVNNVIVNGDETFNRATLMQNPDDQKTKETSEYEFHCDPIAQAF